MKKWKGRFGVALWVLGCLGTGLAAEPRPYLTGATLYLSVDDWADIWLNGIPIVDSQRRTPEEKGFQKIQCVPEHLCYFHQENVLAFVNSNAYGTPQPLGDQVGLAYSLHLRFSDGAQTILSSNDLEDNRASYLPEREEREPVGWHRPEFDDSAWPSALTQGFHIPGLATLTDPETGISTAFLIARPAQTPAPGERHLYRRRFFLDIGPSPYCPPDTKKGFWQKDRLMAPIGRSARRERTPTPGPVALVPARVLESPTPVIDGVTGKPVSDPYRPLREFLALPTFTPVLETTPQPIVTPGEPVIVFDRPPANIYITFADGPGLYQVDVYDQKPSLVKRLLEKKVIADHGEWAVWDGKDSTGVESPPGDYWVLLTKEGKQISRTLIRKTRSP